MSVDRTKVLEVAQKHLAKGNYDKAIIEFKKVVDADPADVRTWLKIGDIYTRKGARREAVETYAKVAQQYGDQGFFLKAVAVYKQILKLDPTRLDIQLKLAEMYEMLQLASDALATYEHVAAGYARAGDIERALSTLSKMADIDPQNIPVRIKLAEALSKAGRTKEAAEAFEVGAGLLKEQGRMDDFMKVAERLLFHRPEDMKLARDLAGLYLERNDAKHALGKLQACFKADAKDVTTLELLAEAFNQLGQRPKTISVLREVARIHQEANRTEERARTLKRMLELDPGDAEARQALASFAAVNAPSVRRDIAPPASAVVEAKSVARPADPSLEEEEGEAEQVYAQDDVEDEDDLEVLDEEDDLIIVEEEIVEPQAAASSQTRSVPPDVQRDAQIARLLTECDVFMRYGLKQKVAEQLHAVLEIDPLHVEARERLKDLHLAQGDVEAAIAELLALADIFAGEHSTASVLYLRQILDIDASNVDALARLAQIGGEVRAPAHAEEPVSHAIAPQEPAAEDEVFFVEEEATADIADLAHASFKPTPVPRADADEADDFAPRTATDAAPLDVPEDHDMPPTRQALVPPPSAGAQPQDALVPPPTASVQPGRGLVPRPSAAALSRGLVPKPSSDGPEQPTRGGLVPKPVHAAPRAVAPEPEPIALGPEAAALAPEPPAVGLDTPVPEPSGGDPLAPMTPEEFDEVPLRASTPGQVAADVARRSFAPGEVEEILDEADFFVAQGLFDEARGTLYDALSGHPGHPLIQEKLREVEHAAAAAHAQRSAAGLESPLADQSFELAEKLAGEFDESEGESPGSDVLDVEHVFAQFKKGVEQQVGMEDSETHFDLGIAYKEMGLLDDAMNEFRLCLTNPQRFCTAETMIGLCLLEKSEVSEAIAHFKKGLYADTKTEREELGLYFELGNAYDLLHDPKEALYYYQKVQKRDPTFRDVGGRIQALAQPQAPAQESPPMAADDIDRAFDDLMGED